MKTIAVDLVKDAESLIIKTGFFIDTVNVILMAVLASPCSGLLHISNISRARVESVGDLLQVDEKVKVLVVKSMFPDKISLR